MEQTSSTHFSYNRRKNNLSGNRPIHYDITGSSQNSPQLFLVPVFKNKKYSTQIKCNLRFLEYDTIEKKAYTPWKINESRKIIKQIGERKVTEKNTPKHIETYTIFIGLGHCTKVTTVESNDNNECKTEII